MTYVIDPTTLTVASARDGHYDPSESCQACGYAIDIHETAGDGVDPNGGCPVDEAEARGRWAEWVS